VVLLDLASLESVCAFGAAELALGKPLDLLINNAGVMAPKRAAADEWTDLRFSLAPMCWATLC
jgi:NAD(P)-dependent dehydrogenase (short-subunit alcohol dehydrogenase family)